MVFQEYNLVERLTVMENLLCGRLGYVAAWRAWLRRFRAATSNGRSTSSMPSAFPASLRGAPMRSPAASGSGSASPGEMQQPDILLADEPTSSLDPKTSVEIMELMAQLAGERDIPVIVNIHNVDLARRFAARIVGMTGGAVVYDGPPGGLTDAHLKRIYGGESRLE